MCSFLSTTKGDDLARRKTEKNKSDPDRLSARARQVLEILYRLGEASAGEILEVAGGDIPSYSAVRSILRQLVRKGRIVHEEKGLRYVYRPSVPTESHSQSALAHVLNTFFGGSPEKTMKALLDLSRSGDYEADLARFEKLIRKAKKEGR